MKEYTEQQAVRALKRKKDVIVSQDGSHIYRLHPDDHHVSGDIGNKCNAYIDFLTKYCNVKLLFLYHPEFVKQIQSNRGRA